MLVWLATLVAFLMRLGKLPPAISHVPFMLLVLGVAAAARSLGKNTSTNGGLRRAWFWACRD